ncbi:hypothetical protein A5753_07520 [Mycobacterium sp. 852002-51971_SCH5477799-a]|nr:hypothetical protein A5753_07520 [Mycobacterium sp. 852002-51971_SCH5477799-a]
MPCLQWLSITLQFVGALVTVGGLTWAWLRATRFRERSWPRIVDALRQVYYRVRGAPVVTGTSHVTLQPMSTAMGMRGLAPRVRLRDGSVEQRLNVLEQVVDRLIDEDIPPILWDVDELRDGVEVARALAKSEAANSIAEARHAIADLQKNLDRTQTLDLRWAIGGLVVSAVGTFLQYWI